MAPEGSGQIVTRDREPVSLIDHQNPIEFGEFYEEIQSEETHARTSGAIARLLRMDRYDATLRLQVAEATSQLQYGTVFHSVLKDGKAGMPILGVSAGFPEALRKLGVPRQEAVSGAAMQVRAYGVFAYAALRAERYKSLVHAHRSSYVADRWLRAPMPYPPLFEPYRVAARVAITTYPRLANVLPEQALPPHLAGFRNPLNPDEFLDHRDILKAVLE